MTFKNLSIAVAFAFCSLVAFGQDEVRVIVGFNGKAKSSTFEKHGGKTKNQGHGFVAGEISAQNVNALRREPGVAYVEEDGIASCTVEDPPQSTPWGISRIKADLVWPTTNTGAGVRVAVCDTGVDSGHNDLAGRVVFGANFTTSPNGDVQGHGSHVSGTIAAASNTIGVVGGAYGATVVDVKVLADNGSGYYSWIINGINWASANNCKVINMSLGGSTGNKTLEQAIKNAWNNGVVICAAAGNNGNTRPNYPAYYSNCIAVCASNESDKRASFSTYGSWCDVSAPGTNVLSTTGGGYESWNGTSMATPHVSATAALVWASSHGTSASSVRNRIESTKGPAIDSNSRKYVPGIINAQGATQ